MRCHPISLFLAVLALISCRVSALEIREVRWGFDGRVVPECFNILSLLVANPSGEAFEGTLVLQERRGMDSGIGAPIMQPVYLAPGAVRFVQFHPFVENEGDWQVRWGQGAKENLRIDAPKLAGPARVLLCDPESPLLSEVRMKIFPDDLFPTSVSMTDGLDAVVLDHMPRWETVRREAFLDWVRRGGVVHLLHGSKGTFPEFTSELALLNGSEARSRIGSGLVLRHAVSRGGVTEPFLAEHGSPERAVRPGSDVSVYAFNQTLLQNLAALTRPEIAWGLIYALAFTYILVIGPGHYFWAKKMNYRTAIALFAAIVVVYGLCFAWAGRRGIGETQRAHSLSIAYPLEGDRYDVMQWNNAFVTRGALYKLTHAAPANFYSVGAPQTEQNIAGRIQNGRDGFFAMDLPLYSSRPFMHRAVMQGAVTAVTPKEWQTDGSGALKGFAFQPPAGFPTEIHAIHARANGKIHPVKLNKEGLWQMEAGKSEQEFFANLRTDFSAMVPFGRKQDDEKRDEETWLSQKMDDLMAHALGGAERLQHFIPGRPIAPDQLQLFIFARVPEGFRLQGGDFKVERGWVLYVRNVFKTDL